MDGERCGSALRASDQHVHRQKTTAIVPVAPGATANIDGSFSACPAFFVRIEKNQDRTEKSSKSDCIMQ
ncbi:MAG: hypothetical protein Q4D31_08140 [Eubacteriales bacterium]|nr:hypothetical protein [Eubacteriales bacterium]